jgi:hypothetical protein
MKDHTDDFARINVRDFARVLPFRADQDVRYYLNGVCVEPADGGGAVIVATNGHMLAAMRSPDTLVTERVIVNVTPAFASAVKKASRSELSFIRAATKTSALEVVNSVPGNGRNRGEDIAFVKPGLPFIDGKFPEWRKIIPSDDKIGKGLPSSYNADYLRRALDAICEGPKQHYHHLIQFYHAVADKSHHSTAIIRMNGQDFVCLVMPVHADNTEAMPGWARSVPAAEPETKAA